MAKDEFRAQVEDIDTDKVEIIKRGDEYDFLKTIENIKDIDERVLLIKNVELLGEKAHLKFKDKTKLVISGDIEKCSFKEELLNIPYRTIILFSDLSNYSKVIPYELQQYEGYIWGSKKGVVKIDVRW